MSRMGPGIFSLTYLSARDKTRAAAFEASESTGKVPGKLERSKKTGQDLGETERMISAIECKKNERKRMRCGGARRGKVGLTAALRGSASNFFRRRAGQGFKGPAKTFLARAGPARNKMGRPGPAGQFWPREGPAWAWTVKVNGKYKYPRGFRGRPKKSVRAMLWNAAVPWDMPARAAPPPFI
jgi:hypothetical protein